MKKEQVQIIILGTISLIFLIWALQLSSNLKSLKKEKKILETKLNQTIKENDFMKVRIQELERKLEEGKKVENALYEKLGTTERMIEELQLTISNLTKNKENLEKELSLFKTKETTEPPKMELQELEVPQEITPYLPESAPIEEPSPSSGEVFPQF